jgi:hypothetical protein
MNGLNADIAIRLTRSGRLEAGFSTDAKISRTVGAYLPQRSRNLALILRSSVTGSERPDLSTTDRFLPAITPM